MEGIESMGSRVDEILQRALKRETEKITEKVREESLKEGRLEGETNGLQRGRQEVARSMVRDGSIPLSKIAEYSGLSINEVESIRNNLR